MPFAATLLHAQETRWDAVAQAFVTHISVGVYDATGWQTDPSGAPIAPSPLPDHVCTAAIDVLGNPADADLTAAVVQASQHALRLLLAPQRYAAARVRWGGVFIAVPEPD